MTNIFKNNLSEKISNLLNEARKRVLQTVNSTMVLTYFEIGRMIVEEEQNGKEREERRKNRKHEEGNLYVSPVLQAK